MKIKDLTHIKDLERLEAIKSIDGVKLDSMDIIHMGNRFTLGRSSVIIHDEEKSLGTELFVDTILGYQIGHYDGRHPERMDVSLDFIKFLIQDQISHASLISENYHQSEIASLYLAKSSNSMDILPIKVYEKIDHKYDELIEEKGGNMKRLRKVERGSKLLRGLGISI